MPPDNANCQWEDAGPGAAPLAPVVALLHANIRVQHPDRHLVETREMMCKSY